MALPHHHSRPQSRAGSRRMSVDPRNELHHTVDHYIGIDVGTGSARACIMNADGDIVGLHSENIGLWQPQTGYYVCSLWRAMLGPIRITANMDIGAIDVRHLALHLYLDSPSHATTQYRS